MEGTDKVYMFKSLILFLTFLVFITLSLQGQHGKNIYFENEQLDEKISTSVDKQLKHPKLIPFFILSLFFNLLSHAIKTSKLSSKVKRNNESNKKQLHNLIRLELLHTPPPVSV